MILEIPKYIDVCDREDLSLFIYTSATDIAKIRTPIEYGYYEEQPFPYWLDFSDQCSQLTSEMHGYCFFNNSVHGTNIQNPIVGVRLKLNYNEEIAKYMMKYCGFNNLYEGFYYPQEEVTKSLAEELNELYSCLDDESQNFSLCPVMIRGKVFQSPLLKYSCPSSYSYYDNKEGVFVYIKQTKKWYEVKPIEWYFDPKTKSFISKKILFTTSYGNNDNFKKSKIAKFIYGDFLKFNSKYNKNISKMVCHKNIDDYDFEEDDEDYESTETKEKNGKHIRLLTREETEYRDRCVRASMEYAVNKVKRMHEYASKTCYAPSNGYPTDED